MFLKPLDREESGKVQCLLPGSEARGPWGRGDENKQGLPSQGVAGGGEADSRQDESRGSEQERPWGVPNVILVI